MCESITRITSVVHIPGNCDVTENAMKFVGYPVIYRISFGLACFFFLFALLMICVKSSKDPRSALQNG